MSEDCIFCKIVAGQIPAEKIYEDEHVLAFMDIGPIVKGHALVIPKTHVDPLDALPADLLSRVMGVVQKVLVAQRSGLGATGVNVIQNNGRVAGQAVFHTHVHVIPRFDNDGHVWNWNPKTYAQRAEMTALAGRIREAWPS